MLSERISAQRETGSPVRNAYDEIPIKNIQTKTPKMSKNSGRMNLNMKIQCALLWTTVEPLSLQNSPILVK